MSTNKRKLTNRRLSVAELQAHGWERFESGWTKNGAFFFQWKRGSMVGQFERESTDYRIQVDLDHYLPTVVKLHLINAVADAARVRDAAVSA